MVNNCLVTKLKGTVDNPNLPIFGVFNLILDADGQNPSADSQYFVIGTEQGEQVTGTITGAGYFTNSGITDNLGKVKTFSGDMWFRSPGEASKLSVTNKYKIISITSPSMRINGDANELLYNDMTKIAFRSTKMFNLSSANVWNNLALFILRGELVEGSIEVFSDKTALTNISVNGTTVTGNIETLGELTELKTLDLSYTLCEGDIATLAESMVSNGRVSGNLVVTSNAIITENGVAMNTGRKITFNSSLPNGYSIGNI